MLECFFRRDTFQRVVNENAAQQVEELDVKGVVLGDGFLGCVSTDLSTLIKANLRLASSCS